VVLSLVTGRLGAAVLDAALALGDAGDLDRARGDAAGDLARDLGIPAI
jgi:hypothetical protein